MRALKGLLSFLGELLPIFFKTIFLLSPFILATVTAYLFGGILLLIIAIVCLAIVVFAGLAWASNKEITDTKLTFGVTICVLILDILLVSPLVAPMISQIRGNKDPGNQERTEQDKPDDKTVTGATIGTQNNRQSDVTNNQSHTVEVAMPTPPVTLTPVPLGSKTVNGFVIQLSSCEISLRVVMCKLDVKNSGPRKRWFGINATNNTSAIKDEFGTQHKASPVMFSNTMRNTTAGALIAPQTTAQATIRFLANPDMTKIVSFRLSCNSAASDDGKWSREWPVEFSNITLARLVEER